MYDRSGPKRVRYDKKTAEGLLFPVMNAISVIGERAKNVLEVSDLQWSEALLREAQSQLMAQLLCVAVQLSQEEAMEGVPVETLCGPCSPD